MSVSTDRFKLFSLFCSLMMLVPLVAYLIVQLNGPAIKKNAFDNLQAIATLKVSQIENWLAERQRDFDFLVDDEMFAAQVQRLLEQGDAGVQAVLAKKLSVFSHAPYYRAAHLLNAAGQGVLTVGTAIGLDDAVVQQLFHTASPDRGIIYSDLYRVAGQAYIAFALPLWGTGAPGLPARPWAMVVLQAPVEPFLYAKIQTWPTASPSGETLLVRRDHDQVLFLNELRHRHGTAFTLRIPLDAVDVPSAVAVRSGQAQRMEGVDYRQVRVFSITQPIAGTPWHLVAKIDRDEVMAPLDQLVYWVGLLTFMAMAVITTALGLLWRQMLHSQRMEWAAKAAARLQASENKFHHLLHSMQDAYVMVDLSGRLIDFNPAYAAMLGYTEDELRGRTSETLTPSTWYAIEAQIVAQQVLVCGQSPVYEKEYIRRDGTVFPVELRTFLLRNSSQQPEAMWAIVRDITERKQTESQLRTAHQQTRLDLLLKKSAVEESPVGVTIVNADETIEYVNLATLHIHGYDTADELEGQKFSILWGDHTPAAIYRSFWATLQSGQTWTGELPNKRKDGSLVWVRKHLSPIRQEDGSIQHFLALQEDVTELRHYRDHMEETVRRRTEELEQARNSAEAATRSKGDFLATMSHEIRTPMNAIIGFSYLCLQTPLTVQQQDYLHKVHQAATSLLRLINDILDFSKMEAGRLELESIAFPLAEVLANVASMMVMKTQEKDLHFSMETAADLPPLLVGDPLRLGQILINLTQNAVKFTEQGEVAIVTERLAQDGAEVHLQFTVRDTGIGMTPEQVAGLFQAFTQADASITRKYGGTGLGLIIAKRLIEQMGGTIRVASTPGQGTRFTFEVRLGIADPAMQNTELQVMDRRGLTALSGARILLVEDNPINQQMARELLEQANMTVLLAENGQEAVDLVGRERLDGVLMDVQMPVMDGLTAARAIRQDSRFAQLPILAMTANAMAGDRERCLAAGMQDHIAKPVDPGALYATLARWIKPAVPQPLPAAWGEAMPEARQPEGCVLPEIPGVDTQAGVQRMGGNFQRYCDLLAKFCVNQGQVDSAIRTALAAQDLATAGRLAHTLKGSAGSIGADLLAERAGRLETALGEEADFARIEVLVQEMSVELVNLCAILAHILPKAVPEQKPLFFAAETAERVEQCRQLFRKAASQLEKFDAEIEHTLAALHDVAWSQEMLDWVIKMEQQVAQYDFERAVEILRQCARSMNIILEAEDA
ncbi:MAG: PAS domain S-box protein [Magnetococcales bacterium]|nr:PAS domain S-box protein [Magnetococcales bacterium]